MKQNDLAQAKASIASSFKELAAASEKLQEAADELTSTISNLEKLLRNLKLGVSAWYQIARASDEEGWVETRDLGYANVKGKWGIAIRKTNSNAELGEYDENVWPFAEAPRWMCVEAVKHLPDLVKALLDRTVETTKNFKSRTVEAQEIITATATVAAQIMTTSKGGK